jgi:hypothetical protein
VNQDNYINRVLHEPDEHHLTMEEFDTRHVMLGVRILVDAYDPADVDVVNELQDQLAINADSDEPVTMCDYDAESFTSVREALRSNDPRLRASVRSP